MKWVIYRFCISGGLIFCVVVIIAGAAISFDYKTILSIVGGILSFIYFVQRQKLEEMRLFKELFTEFNERYDALNKSLNKIVMEKDFNKDFNKEDIDILYSYFNLCGEEYFYYKKGFIYPKVWKAWRNGMKIFYQNKKIRETWADELETNSYYGFQLSELEKH